MGDSFAIASDHAGFKVKEDVKSLLASQGISVLDCGTTSDASVDYPDYAEKAIRSVIAGKARRAVLVCGSGVGMSIVANRFPGIRAALVMDASTAEMCRKHNDANVLVLPGWKLGDEALAAILRAWVATDFEGGRHQRRLDKITALEKEIAKPE